MCHLLVKVNKVISISMFIYNTLIRDQSSENYILPRNKTSLEDNISEYDFPTIIKEVVHFESEHIYICKARVNVIRLCPCVTINIMVSLEGVTQSQIINWSWILCDP